MPAYRQPRIQLLLESRGDGFDGKYIQTTYFPDENTSVRRKDVGRQSITRFAKSAQIEIDLFDQN